MTDSSTVTDYFENRTWREMENDNLDSGMCYACECNPCQCNRPAFIYDEVEAEERDHALAWMDDGMYGR